MPPGALQQTAQSLADTCAPGPPHPFVQRWLAVSPWSHCGASTVRYDSGAVLADDRACRCPRPGIRHACHQGIAVAQVSQKPRVLPRSCQVQPRSMPRWIRPRGPRQSDDSQRASGHAQPLLPTPLSCQRLGRGRRPGLCRGNRIAHPEEYGCQDLGRETSFLGGWVKATDFRPCQGNGFWTDAGTHASRQHRDGAVRWPRFTDWASNLQYHSVLHRSTFTAIVPGKVSPHRANTTAHRARNSLSNLSMSGAFVIGKTRVPCSGWRTKTRTSSGKRIIQEQRIVGRDNNLAFSVAYFAPAHFCAGYQRPSAILRDEVHSPALRTGAIPGFACTPESKTRSAAKRRRRPRNRELSRGPGRFRRG